MDKAKQIALAEELSLLETVPGWEKVKAKLERIKATAANDLLSHKKTKSMTDVQRQQARHAVAEEVLNFVSDNIARGLKAKEEEEA